MSDEFPIEEPIVIPPIEIDPIILSDGTEIEVKPIPAVGAEYVDYRRKIGYTGDCTLKLTVNENQDPLDIAVSIKAALEIELVYKSKVDPLSEEQRREKLKALRTTAVNSIVVTTSTGKAFDGDEISQSRMSRVVTAMMLAGVTDGIWTLANNETVPVTLAELQEAIVLSVQQMAEKWPLDQYEAVLDPLSVFSGITPPENPVDPNDLLGQLP